MLIDVSGQRQDVGTQSLRDTAGVVRCACGCRTSKKVHGERSEASSPCGPFSIPMRFPYFGKKYNRVYVSIGTFIHPTRITFCLHQMAREDGYGDIDRIVDLSRCDD